MSSCWRYDLPTRRSLFCVLQIVAQRMESRGVLLEMLNKVSCIHFVKKRGAILEFIDVDFFNRSADEFLAAVFGYLLNTYTACQGKKASAKNDSSPDRRTPDR